MENIIALLQEKNIMSLCASHRFVSFKNSGVYSEKYNGRRSALYWFHLADLRLQRTCARLRNSPPSPGTASDARCSLIRGVTCFEICTNTG